MVMMIASIGFYTLGVILFCQRFIIILGNVCFLIGMYMFIGLAGTLGFLTKKGNKILNQEKKSDQFCILLV